MSMRRFSISLFAAAGLCLLSACSTPPTPQIYTLQGESSAVNSARQGPQRLIDLSPIVIPERLFRRQLVLRDSQTQLKVLEQHRWSSLLSDELNNALSEALQQRLQALDVGQVGGSNAGLPVYRISTEVSRLDAALNGALHATVGWSVQRQGTNRMQTCIAQFQQATGDSIASVVEAHQRLVQTLADAIAASQRALDSAGDAPYCRAS